MYLPPHFSHDDRKTLLEVMKRFPFASVISTSTSTSTENAQIQISHLPVTAEITSRGLSLYSHMARGNPQWRQFKNADSITIAFQGPHTYIHPGWYTENDVTTWNYVAVHAQGKPELIEDTPGLLEILKKTTRHMNEIYPEQWDFYLPEDLQPEVIPRAIIGFSILNPTLEGKFKLNQNRSDEDQAGVIQGLRKRAELSISDPFSLVVADLMEHEMNSKASQKYRP
jgi:transcriptional regulator